MSTDRPRVLIVDDDLQVGRLIKEELTEQGLACWNADDALVAKGLLDDRHFDILIADILMPHSGGLDLLAHVRTRRPSCRVILITGHSRRDYLAQALLLGAYDYVEKPFAPGELAKVVHRAACSQDSAHPLAARAAEALELATSSREAALGSVQALADAVEAKDPYTRRHSEQVAHYAVHLAKALALSPETVEAIRAASLLHDIGKIGVPDHILIKPEPLTEAEWEVMRRHPTTGSDILARIPFFRLEAQWVRHHHERWDGRGYPDGLQGEETPLPSRIIQLADCIDAMLMARTYKKQYPVQKMLHELVRGAGKQFDPRIAAAAVQWCHANPDQLILNGSTPGVTRLPARA